MQDTAVAQDPQDQTDAIVQDLIGKARVAMAEYAREIEAGGQQRIDDAVTALAWSIYKPENAKRFAEVAVEVTGSRYGREQDHQKYAQDVRHAA